MDYNYLKRLNILSRIIILTTKDNMIIVADVDQIYGIRVLIIYERNICNIITHYYKCHHLLLYFEDISFLPKEIYNITSIENINMFYTIKKLIISNKIINLHNMKLIVTNATENIIISREIMKLPNHVTFKLGTRLICDNDKYYTEYVTGITQILGKSI